MNADAYVMVMNDAYVSFLGIVEIKSTNISKNMVRWL